MGVERYTVEELAELTGHTVRNIRYYTGLGLLPAPGREGRVAVYGALHRARLELITALQVHGFTLEAISRYLDHRGVGATPEDLSMQRAMITSWTTGSARQIQADIARELRDLGLPKDALAAAHEATTRHMEELADELDQIFRSQIVAPFVKVEHTPEEAAVLERGVPRLRELTVQAVVIAFQGAMNRAISKSLSRVP